MHPPLKIVLAGLGRMGRNHLRVLRETPGFSVVAIVDPILASADVGLTVVKTTNDLAGIDFDAAIIATPTATHFEVARAFLEMGKHLFIEKPIASTTAEAHQIVQLAADRGVRLAVGHVERFNPAVRKLREVIQEGWLGTPIHFSFTRVGGYPDTLLEGNNVLLDLAVHDVDVLRSIVGPLHVEAALCHSAWTANVFDTAEIFLSAKSGVSATIHVNWVTPTKIRTIRVTGTRGVCFVDYILQSCELFGGSLLKITAPPNFSYEAIQEVYRTTDKVAFGVRKEEPLRAQAEQLLRFFRSGDAGELCTGADAAAIVQVAEIAVQSGTARARDAQERTFL